MEAVAHQAGASREERARQLLEWKDRRFVLVERKLDSEGRQALRAPKGTVVMLSPGLRGPTRRRPNFYDGTRSSTWVQSTPIKVSNPVLLADRDACFMQWDGLNIHYKLTPKPHPDSLTLVLMHGFSGNLANFNNVWSTLARDNQLLAFDRPGWGLSARARRREDGTWPTESGQNPYTYDYSRQLLRGVLEKLDMVGGQHKLVLMGHSHGGATTAYILCHDEFLRHLFKCGCVLVDGPLLAWPVPAFAAKMVAKMPRFSRSLVNLCAGPYKWGAGFKLGVSYPFYNFNDFLKAYPDGAVGWDHTFRVTGWRVAFVEWCLANAKRAEMDLTKLQQIPTLDIRGAKDRVIKPNDGLRCQPQTGATCILVPRAGHLPFADQPDTFLHHLNDFLDGLRVTCNTSNDP